MLIAIFSFVRIVKSLKPSGGRKVIATFNFLIFFTSFSRAIWFLIPNSVLEVTYTPTPQVAFSTDNWLGTLISELLLITGSLSLYGIFILVACYWVHLLNKLQTEMEPQRLIRYSTKKRGTLEMFTIIMIPLIATQLLSVILYFFQFVNSETMILYGSILLSIVSIAIVLKITILSKDIRIVLKNMEFINNRNSQPQIRRISAIIIVANLFFISRVILELTLSISLIKLMTERHSFSVIISDKYWSIYIAIKHVSEIVVLTLELLISTAIKTYDNTKVSLRHNLEVRNANQARNVKPLDYKTYREAPLEGFKNNPKLSEITPFLSQANSSYDTYNDHNSTQITV